MNTDLLKKLPTFRNPPVNEVVCGMRFRPLDKLRIPHIGILWDKFRKDYPMLQHASPISSGKGEILVDKATGLPLPRVWFINSFDDQLIQFQTDRFYFNWRRKEREYPRYHSVINNFESVLNAIKYFINDNELGAFEPIEYELSYINHIPKGIGWNTIDDLPEIFSNFIWDKTKTHFLSKPEDVNWTLKFLFDDQKSQLTVGLKQAIRTEDRLPILIFELNTTGITQEDNIHNWFDLAHHWIVLGFTDLTTEKMHKIWEKEENA